MKAKLSILTLGVADLARAKQFYLDLGFPVMTGSEDYPGIAFFQLEGLAFALYPQEKLAEDLWGDQAPTGGATAALPRHTMARNEASEAEVDTTIAEAVAAGAKLIKPATKAFWGGYSGYFADPDGHMWEVAYNPFMDLS
mgnify:CR=1 FL=1